MQPSNQLKGLVESYGNVYANRQQTEELKQIAETIINCVGVNMIENGYVESDVKEFFERSSIGKILDVFGEAVESEGVLQNVNESTGLYETHLRYIPGAMATRMKNESPEIVNRLASRLNEEDLHEFVGGLIQKGKQKARELKQGLQGVVKGAGKVAGNVLKSAPAAVEKGIKYTAGSALAGPLGGLAATKVPSVTGLLGGGRGRRGPGQGSGRPSKDPTAGSSTPSVKQPITKQPAGPDGTGPLRPRAGDERARPTTPSTGGGRSGGGSGSAATTRPSSGATAAPTQSTTSTAAPAPTTKKRTFNPLMQRTFGYQTGQAPDQIAKRKAAAAKAGADFGSAIKAGQKMKKESSELDLVVNHLFTEGYAETLDGALSMVEGMSDQFINNILEQVYMESAMVEFLIQSGEAESIEEANYIISELDEENLNLLIQSVMEGEANVKTIRALERKIQAGGGFGSAHGAAPGKQSLGAAYYKAVQRGRV
ncbi:hypothetical protein HOU04_gp129 [Synechococcus phage S-T4]|uniref:Uncharacterized protein n=1 Tax=Synechococcus phage S-T4 TaxID=2268578 RepID=A0A385EHI4_9CAUD|nr:hypothetical protein HOU04_gp129 [Synechococcus phage S-T4]AXQ70528.1 hypothetical protein [Synechococcus phage S-T4]